MKRHLPTPQSDDLHPTLAAILPPPERAVFHQHSDGAIRSYPALNLSACKTTPYIISPADGEPSAEYRNHDKFHAMVSLTCSHRSSPVLSIRAVLVGRLVSTDGLLTITDSATYSPLVIAPPPNACMRNKFVYAVNWRYIPASGKCKGYFEVLASDLVLLTRAIRDDGYSLPPANVKSNLTSLSGTIRAKSCRIATRRQFSCFLVELVGVAHATVIVFRDDAVSWWPFLRVGSCVTIRRLQLCSLPGYNGRTAFKASSPDLVVEMVQVERPAVDVAPAPFNRPVVPPSNSTRRAHLRCVYRERTVDYEGFVTQILPDGRLELDQRITFHPGPVHSFAPDVTISSAFRSGTKISVFNALLVQRDEHVRLFPTAKTSIEILYFGELKTIGKHEKIAHWRYSGWDLLWKRLDYDDVLWAEEMYDMLATKFWHWLRGSSQDLDETTDSDRIACMLGDRNEIGLVQYTMHLLSGRKEWLNQESFGRRNTYKEFLELPGHPCNTSRALLPAVTTLERLKEMVLDSGMKTETSNAEPGFNRLFTSSVSEDLHLLHHSQVVNADGRPGIAGEKSTVARVPSVLAGLLHKLKSGSEQDALAISDSTTTIPVRIVGLLEPTLIGAIVLVTDYYFVVDFRHGAHESVTAVFASIDVKTLVDGPYAEMGNQPVSGPLRCETQACNRNNKESRNRPPQNTRASQQGSVVLTRGIPHQSAGGDNVEESVTRIADVPLVCTFVENLVLAPDRVELCGKLVAVRKSQMDDAWKVVLRHEDSSIFWECRIFLFGDAIVDLGPVFRENRLWSVSCVELEREEDPLSYIQRKGAGDQNSRVVLSSTFDGFVPWVEDLGKGEYMRYRVEGSDQWGGSSNLSVMSREGTLYNTVRDAVEKFYELSRLRITTRLWELHQGNEEAHMVHICGTVTHNSAWNLESTRGEGNTEWILTIKDDELAFFTIPVDFRNRVDCVTGLAPGMRIVLHNVHRVRRATWERYRFEAGENTIVRCTGMPDESDCTCQTRSITIDNKVVRTLPRVDLLDLEVHPGTKWVGILRFDILNLLELRFRTRHTHCLHGVRQDALDILVTLSIEDGTTHGRLHASGAAAEAMLEILPEERARLEALAERGTMALDQMLAKEHGLIGLWKRKGFGWRRVTGVVVGVERVVGDEAIVKCYRLGFGQSIWTAERREVVVVECVGVFNEGPALVRELLYALDDG